MNAGKREELLNYGTDLKREQMDINAIEDAEFRNIFKKKQHKPKINPIFQSKLDMTSCCFSG